MKDDLKWWNQFYTELEAGLTSYTRPKDWKERAANAGTRHIKPVRNQKEGLTRNGEHHE